MLDALANRYFAVSREQSSQLQTVVRGWPHGSDASWSEVTNLPAADLAAVVDDLVHAGLLNRKGDLRDEIVPIEVRVDGSVSSVGDEIVSSCQVRLRHIVYFLVAYAWSVFALHFRPFHKVLRHVSRTKTLLSDREVDLSRTADLVSIFRRVRPFVFSVKGRCLLHALTLTKFLAYNNVPAAWVIGVTSLPWSAHSWVQQGSYILDSNPEKVCHFTPILAV